MWESALLGVLRREVPAALPGGGAGGPGLHALPRRPGAAGQGGGTGQRSRRYTAAAGGQAKSCQPDGILFQVRPTYRTVPGTYRILQGFGSGSGFHQVNGSGSGSGSVFGIRIRIQIQEGENDPQK